MTTLQLADIPNTDVSPQGAGRSAARRAIVEFAFGRRAFLKGFLVTATASALVSFEGILKRTGAYAAPPTHVKCADWQNAASNGWWTECNPLATEHASQSESTIGNDQIGHRFCGPGDYHRTDSEWVGTGVLLEYGRRNTCAGKNAWSWRINEPNAQSWPNKRSRRCSDGRVRSEHNGTYGGTRNTVCETRFPESNPPASSLPFDKYTPDGCPPGENPNTAPARC